jgi:hypothetical protein
MLTVFHVFTTYVPKGYCAFIIKEVNQDPIRVESGLYIHMPFQKYWIIPNYFMEIPSYGKRDK